MPRSRIVRNVASNWLLMAWSIGWGIALVPIYLHYLGTSDYGIWVLMNAVIGYYGLFDIGLRPALMRHVARYIGLDDAQGLNEIFNTAWIVQSGLGTVVVLVSLALALSLPRLEGFVLHDVTDAAALILLFGAGAALSFIGGSFGSALSGAERFDVGNALVLASSLVVNAGHIVVLYLGGGLLEMAAVVLSARLFEAPIAAYASVRAIPGLRLSTAYFRVARIKELFGYGIHAFVVATGERLRLATDAIVISAFLPASAVAIFNIGNRPMGFLTDIVRGISNVLTPAFSRQEAAAAPAQLSRLLLLSTRMTSLLAFLGCLLLATTGDRLLTLWLGAGFDESFAIMLVLIPAYLMETSLAPTGAFLLGTRGYTLISGVIICEGIANLLLSLWLIGPLGLTGVAIGTVIPMIVVRLFILPTLAGRIAGVSLLRLLAECWLPAIPAVVAGWLAAKAAVAWFPGTSLIAVGASVSLVAATYCVAAATTLAWRRDALLQAWR